MKKLLKKASEHWVITGIIVVIVIALVFGGLYILQSGVNIDMTETTTVGNNVLYNPTASAYDYNKLPVLKVVQDKEKRVYEDIVTQTFTFVGEDGNAVALVKGHVALEDLITAVNSYLETSKYRICAVGIIGSQLYLQQDTSQEVEGTMKMNIMTIKDNIEINDWLKIIETINQDTTVYTTNIITYQTDTGSRHYMYIYLADGDNVVENITKSDDS